MLLMSDMVFDLINCRPDGMKPSMECLQSTVFSMFGDDATSLQNDGRSLEEFFKERSAWTHLWKESITSFESNSGPGSKRIRANEASGSTTLPSDLSDLRDMNNTFLKSMQSSIDKRLKGLKSSGSRAATTTATADGKDAPPRKVYKGEKGSHHRGASRRGGSKGCWGK